MISPAEQPRLVERLVASLQVHVGRIIAEVILEKSCCRCGLSPGRLQSGDLQVLVPEMEKHIALFVREASTRQQCLGSVSALRAQDMSSAPIPDVVVALHTDMDVVEARNRARELAARMGFPHNEQTKIATVISELSRNVVMYAGHGKVTLRVREAPRPALEVIVEDTGPGIPDLDAILAGTRKSRTGLGLGVVGSKRLMNEFDITTTAGRGTRITAAKYRN